jgi:hypothetical protein
MFILWKLMGQSRTSKYYDSHPAAKAKRQKQQAELNKTEKETKRRTELNKLNRSMGKKGDGKDVSHKKGGGVTLEKASSNRARNGSNGKSTKR